MKKTSKAGPKREKGVIRLQDLVPRGNPKGGAGRTGPAVFGVGPVEPEEAATPPESPNDSQRGPREE